MPKQRTLRILGIRGLPARHGGFETFAEHLARYLVRLGWNVTVYCQEPRGGDIRTDVWQGIRRVLVPSGDSSPWSTMRFDMQCIRHAAQSNDLCLTLGYNTAVFGAWLKARGVTNIINMDGVEWKRSKWGWYAKAWLYANDWIACWLGDHLIADHPQIERLLSTRADASKITCIPYGADEITSNDATPLQPLGLEPGRYLSLVARTEPENSVLELVRAFSRRSRGVKLAVLGQYHDHVPFHRAVKDAASDEVVFLGPIYDATVLSAIRKHSLAYLHGHRVGGTNPSLLEAMGAGNAVIAHDNPFNRWVAGEGAVFFACEDSADQALSSIVADAPLRTRLAAHSLARARSEFAWDSVLSRYHSLLVNWSREASPVDSAAVRLADDGVVARTRDLRP